MDYVAVFLEHINLLNRLDRLHIELFQRCLKFLIVGSRRFVDLFRFSPWGAFAADFRTPLAMVENGARETTGTARLRWKQN